MISRYCRSHLQFGRFWRHSYILSTLSPEERSLGQPSCLHWTYTDTLSQDISYLPVLFLYTSRTSSWVTSTRNRRWESTVRCFFAWISLCHSPHLFYPLPSKHQTGAARVRLLRNSEDGNPEGYLWTQRWKYILWGTSGQRGWRRFDSKLKVAKAHWTELEKSDGAKPGFYSWFVQNKVNSMKATMLKTVRAEAGLGSPPQPFTTNASETTNSVIKAHVLYKHSQLMEFVNHLKDVVDEQEREVERAVIRRGKFRFK